MNGFIGPVGFSCASLFLFSNCKYFVRQPPLPSHAAIESAVIPAGDAKFSALVQSTDIIYFPSEAVGSSGRFEAAWKLVEALRRADGAFALGWDVISGDEQPQLDRWAKEKVATGEIPELHLHGSSAETENCRKFLRAIAPLNVQVLGLSQPAQERADVSDAPDVGLPGEQFAAGAIARYFQANRGDKILVFLHRAHLGRDHGVPFLVAQKVRARQLVLDSRPAPASGRRLLAGSLLGRRGWGGGSLQIVNGAPIAGSDLP